MDHGGLAMKKNKALKDMAAQKLVLLLENVNWLYDIVILSAHISRSDFAVLLQRGILKELYE